MTHLINFAKRTTYKLADAMAKFPVMFINFMFFFFTFNTKCLNDLPKIALAAIMMFTCYRMLTDWHMRCNMVLCANAGFFNHWSD